MADRDNNVSSTGDGDSGSMYGMFASKIGAGAAKIGKKAAQSEAGRSASKAAVKGATDAATKDLTDRFLKRGEYSTKPQQTVVVTTTVSTAPESKPSSSAADTQDDDDRPYSPESYVETRRNPPKPSVFQRFKPHINMKSSSKSSQPPSRPRPKPHTGERRVYKRRLAKEPNWDREVQAMTLYNYRAEMKCDLEFRKGQIISVIFRTDTQNDWWEGKLDGKVGIFPANYVRLL